MKYRNFPLMSVLFRAKLRETTQSRFWIFFLLLSCVHPRRKINTVDDHWWFASYLYVLFALKWK